ncbi:hypothetical protein DPEC_G00185070 [Dallia pectoralis]|uniref:Uncharacterized protein n=1 Tax=Dallia pectoralis TaxID=75939 RepID=A0ACC2GB88_DALPE|nr:hypothetical protein DPEC_G00185070 [Dallia pectoralis]
MSFCLTPKTMIRITCALNQTRRKGQSVICNGPETRPTTASSPLLILLRRCDRPSCVILVMKYPRLVLLTAVGLCICKLN